MGRPFCVWNSNQCTSLQNSAKNNDIYKENVTTQKNVLVNFHFFNSSLEQTGFHTCWTEMLVSHDGYVLSILCEEVVTNSWFTDRAVSASVICSNLLSVLCGLWLHLHFRLTFIFTPDTQRCLSESHDWLPCRYLLSFDQKCYSALYKTKYVWPVNMVLYAQ